MIVRCCLRAPVVSLVLLCAVLTALSACDDRAPDAVRSDLPIGIDALTNLTALSEIRPPGVRAEQTSSYDRSGGNEDLGIGPDVSRLLELLGVEPIEIDHSYLYRDGERYVIFDEVGPGVVYRLWMADLFVFLTGVVGDGDVVFEIDDEPEPRLRLSRKDLFSGQIPPFIAPLAGDDDVSSGGLYSMVPIAFARRLRITTSHVPHWLQLTWVRLPAEAQVESFDPSADVTRAAELLADAGNAPEGQGADRELAIELSIDPGESVVAWERSGPGTIVSLELATGDDGAIPPGLRLQATWDDARSPQLDAPLDELFAASLGPGARSLAVGYDGSRAYLHLPMPFRSGARLVVRNDGDEAVVAWTLRLSVIDRLLGSRPGYLYGAARAAHLDPDGRDYVLLETTGTGHVVWVAMTAGCGAAGRCMLDLSPGLDGSHLEGDERVTIDGTRQPQIHGTGLEDFFGGGFYFIRGAFTLPTHGNPAQEPGTSPRRPGLNLRSMYRLFLGDAIPFRSHIRLAVEHGPSNDVPAAMSSVVLYYAVPEIGVVESDRIEIGSPASERSHALEAEGRADRTVTSAFRGDDSDVEVTAHGMEASRTAFRVTIDPANAGVRLRRLADLAGGRQRAIVRVDGKPAGVWYTADVNPILRLADLDFDIPPELTRGRDSLAIELDARDSPSPWTAYGYAALSELDVPVRR